MVDLVVGLDFVALTCFENPEVEIEALYNPDPCELCACQELIVLLIHTLKVKTILSTLPFR